MASCQEFKQWLINCDSTDDNVCRQYMDHIQGCQTCKELYQTDMTLEGILKKGMQSIDPPPGLIERAQRRVEPESRPRPFRFLRGTWRTVLPALSMAALVLAILLNPFSGHLQTIDEVVAHSIENHLNTGMGMTFRAGEFTNIDQWFSQRLGYAVRLPDLKRLGLDLVGGRKCSLGKIDAALLLCQSKGKRASLFMINQKDVGLRFDKERKYIVEEGDVKVTVWKESGMVYAIVI